MQLINDFADFSVKKTQQINDRRGTDIHLKKIFVEMLKWKKDDL